MSGIINKIPSRSKIIVTAATVDQGGTGVSTLTDGGILLGSGTGAITATAALADGEMLVGDGTTDPSIESGATLRTSIGVGTGNAVTFDKLTATTGVLFGSDTAAANTLDDYEQGIWTPAMQDGGSSFSYNDGDWGRFGYYTRIGNVVFIKGRLVLTGGTMTTGTVTISLPITPSGWGTGDIATILCRLDTSASVNAAYTSVLANVNTNSNGFAVRQVIDTGAQVPLYGTQLGSSGNISFSGHYFISP